MTRYHLARYAFVVSAALILFGITACKREAIGVVTSVTRQRVLLEDQTLAWKILSLSIKLDDGRTVTLKGDDAQAAADLITQTMTAANVPPDQKFRLRLQRSWLGRWRVVEALKVPNTGGSS